MRKWKEQVKNPKFSMFLYRIVSCKTHSSTAAGKSDAHFKIILHSKNFNKMEHQQSSYYDVQGQKRSCEESNLNWPTKYQLTENMLPQPPPPPPVIVVTKLDPVMFKIQGQLEISKGKCMPAFNPITWTRKMEDQYHLNMARTFPRFNGNVWMCWCPILIMIWPYRQPRTLIHTNWTLLSVPQMSQKQPINEWKSRQ